ncbi:hypothetical protein BZG02_12505 [Labilibaculum filiforme]|uniref:LTD domain-containing protein n=1 Tax=Labilibaculum filiforme TaxID=1940526 RepID=A0A2N3HWY1_9BACT|nr:lamin tail domain-containing protein [Labilibaculum filiforme]PKQ62537.1 hypothetical protein BZG02_12505 [Labilibaculum filiforme]
MKKTLSLKLFLFLFLLNSYCLYADDIWKTDFTNDVGKGYWGSSFDMGGITDWFLDISNCTLSDDEDYLKVVATSGGRLEAKDIDGEATWKSKVIDISDFTDISISLVLAETGSSTSASKFAKAYYVLDGAEEILLEGNGDNVGNWGSVNASQSGLNGNSLEIVIRINNPNAGDLVYVDEIVVSGNPVVPETDKLTRLYASENFVDPVQLGTSCNEKEKALPFFRFVVDETAAAADGFPTKIAGMTFYNSNPEKGMNWKECIGGLCLYLNGIEIVPQNIMWDQDSILLNFKEDQITIPDAEKMEFELRIYLNANHSLRDGETLQLNCMEAGKGFTTFVSGSGFNSAIDEFHSAVHQIEVLATRMIFSECPDHLIRNRDFSILVAAVDDFNNVDLDAVHAVSLSLEKGTGNLESLNGFQNSLVKGEASFYSLNYSQPEIINLAITNAAFAKTISEDILVENTFETDVNSHNSYVADSTISSFQTKKEKAVEVFRFSVQDAGKDNAPTILNQIRFIGSNKNQVNWKKCIEKFIVKNKGEELNSEFLMAENYLDIQFPETELARVIESEETSQFSVYCFLKEGKTVDGSLFQMEIDSLHAGWIVSDLGSGLKTQFTGNLAGPEFTFEVVAKEMSFTSIPKSVNYKEDFSILVQLMDSLGNVDTNSEFEIALSLASGSGELSSENLKMSSSNGSFNWEHLNYSEAENFTIQAECDYFPTILSDNISGTDKTSLIVPASSILSTTLSSLATSEKKAIPVLNFKILDAATHDNLPTIISSLKFYNLFPDGYFSWEQHISGAVLLFNGNILASTATVSEDCIEFTSSKGVLDLQNNGELNLTLAIFFRKGQLPDNDYFQVGIPKNHEWKCVESGSKIQETLPEEIVSEIYSISVQASQLSFASSPFGITNSQEKFSLKIVACDAFKNIDKDAVASADLRLLNGNGEIIVPNNNLPLKNGMVTIDSVQYSGTERFELTTESNLEPDSIKILLGPDDLGICEDFESKSLENWMNTKDWMVSSYLPIKGDYSLKHNLSEEYGRSFISKSLSDCNPNASAINWQFIIRNGDWDPSSGNKFAFHVLMDNLDPEKATSKYSVGVNQTGAGDFLSLWSLDQDQKLQVLLVSSFNWNENESLAIWVSYSPNGVWEMRYNRLGIKENWISAGRVASEVDTRQNEWFSALDFTFETASRAGNLWLDDLQIEAINTAPFLKSYEIVGADSLLLEFSEQLDFPKSSESKNFALKNANGLSCQLKVMPGLAPNYLLLILDNELKTGDYLLELFNITDLKGAVLKKESIHFGYFAPATIHDVIINELMVDETPSAGLPEYEYIELYNASEYPIAVKNWILKVGEKEAVLTPDTIPAKGYLILCANAGLMEFSSFGDVLGVSGFPGLTNSGGTVEIQSDARVLIDKLSYSDTWYLSNQKSDGGWSLERIDPKNTSWQENNWMASVNELGGTPGTTNSIYAENQDIVTPSIELCKCISANGLQLVFSEPMESVAMFNLANFQISPDLIHPKEIIQIDLSGREFQLYFKEDFIVNSQYRLIFTNEIKDLAGNIISVKECDFWVPGLLSEGDLVINEVLFNPYPDGSDYVEIVNISDKVIDLSKLKLATRTENFELTGLVTVSEQFLLPNEYLLLTDDTLNIQQNYATCNSVAFCQLKSFPCFSDKTGRVVLISNDELIDEFAYHENMHFELLASKEGVSLERINPNGETNSEANWQSAAQNVGFGTPGLQNSVYNSTNSFTSEISLVPQVFTPDNDGFDDRLLIHIHVDDDAYLTTVRIYNSMGIEIRKLANNLNLANEDSLFWDGLTSQKERAPIGIYLVYIELFSPNGKRKIFKESCVLGGKFN